MSPKEGTPDQTCGTRFLASGRRYARWLTFFEIIIAMEMYCSQASGQKSKVWSAGPGRVHTAWQDPGGHATRRRRRLHATGQRPFATTATAFVERDALTRQDGSCYGG